MRALRNLTLGLAAAILLLSSCASVEKAYYKGDYDYVIHKLEKKLSKKNQKDEHILLLEEAYAKVLKNDLEKIDYLRKSNPVNNWKKVLAMYETLDTRQATLKRYLPLHIVSQGRDADFDLYNFKQDILTHKNNVAEYLYSKANTQLRSSNKNEVRKAYDTLLDLKKIMHGYKDVNTLLSQSLNAGKNYILVNVQNKSNAFLHPELEREITNLGTSNLNAQWLVYHNKPAPNVQYDYIIDVVLQEMFVDLPAVATKDNRMSKRVEDGWEYVLDKKGNVKKDSLGNDIKRTKYTTVNAVVTEFRQIRNSTIAGRMYIYEAGIGNRAGAKGQLVNSDPIRGTHSFENTYFDYKGDKRAVTKGWMDKIRNNKPLPVPQDIDMLLAASNTFKPAMVGAIRDNRNLVLH